MARLLAILVLAGGCTELAPRCAHERCSDVDLGATTDAARVAGGTDAGGELDATALDTGDAALPDAALPDGDPPIELDWVPLEGGPFTMGDGRGNPLHAVQVPAFEMTRAEITQAEFGACVEAGVCDPPTSDVRCNWGRPERDDHPANCVEWQQARAFARWAHARLPSESEWEFAARSRGQDRPYPWGIAEPTCALAVMREGDALSGCEQDRSAPTCSTPGGHTEQGLCDMAGNVWEWVEDAYGDYEDAPTDGRPQTDGTVGVLRGGCWYCNDPAAFQTTYRLQYRRDARDWGMGFRLARAPQ